MRIKIVESFYLSSGSLDQRAWLQALECADKAGFGSLIVDDHKKVTQKILDAIEITGQRLLLSKCASAGYAEY